MPLARILFSTLILVTVGAASMAAPTEAQVLTDAQGRAVVSSRCEGTSGAHVGGVMADLLTGAPRAGVPVVIKAGGEERMTVTEDGGVFVACGLPGGEQASLEVMTPEGETNASKLVLPGDVSWAGTRYLADTAPARVQGWVTDGDTGLPVAGARVTVAPLELETRTDEEGFFRVHGIAGEVTIRVGGSGYELRDYSTWLEGGFTYDALISLYRPTVNSEAPAPVVFTRGADPFEPAVDAAPRLFSASGGGGAPPAAFDWNRLTVGEATRVQLTAPGVVVEDGILVRNGQDGNLTVTEGGQTWTIPEESVRSLSLRGSSSKRMAVVGAIAGFATGAVLGAKFLLETDRCFEQPQNINGTPQIITVCTRKPVGVMKFGPGFAVAGAAAGWTLGWAVRRWVPAF